VSNKEIIRTVGLFWSSILLFAGVLMIADWRRKERGRKPAVWRSVSETVANRPHVEVPFPYQDEFEPRGLSYPHAGLGRLVSPTQEAHDRGVASLKEAFSGLVGNVATACADVQVEWFRPSAMELRLHLTDALAILEREPSLTIDAGTLATLAKHKAKAAPVRGPDGRWRKA